jgi:hypothetical protein
MILHGRANNRKPISLVAGMDGCSLVFRGWLAKTAVGVGGMYLDKMERNAQKLVLDFSSSS